MAEFWVQLTEMFGPEAVVEFLARWGVKATLSLIILAVGWGVARLVTRLLSTVFRQVDLDHTAATFVVTVVRLVVGIVALLASLDQLGVNTTSILASLGVVGLTLGFAAQDTLSNVISGLFIFWDRPFVIGDLVEIDGQYGQIDTITLRSTRLVTPDGRMMAIPNKNVASGRVTSYTNFPNLRIDIPVTVNVNTDLQKARRILLSLVEEDAAYMASPAPVVVVNALNDYNVELELRGWLQDETIHVRKRFELREKVYEALNEAGIDMPFETIAINPIEVRQTA